MPSDFYVRDWTQSASTFDRGPEPSTNPTFWTTSDVWAQSGAVAVAFGALDRPPDNETIATGTGVGGDNYVFARVSRRTAAAPTVATVNVQAQFSWADWGAGTPFSNIGTPSPVSLAAADLSKALSPGLLWHLDATSTSHICLAVEISDLPNDPPQAPPLVGRTPGSATGASIVNDNNKAQRNLEAIPTPSGGAGGAGAAFFAAVENSDLIPRDVVLRWAIAPDLAKRVREASVTVGEVRSGGAQGELQLKGLQPAERRWIALQLPVPAGKPGELLAVNFAHFVDGRPATGFAAALRPAPLDEVVRYNLRRHGMTFARIAGMFGLKEADVESVGAIKLLPGGLVEKDYAALLAQHLPAMRAVVDKIGALKAGGAFDALSDFERLAKLLQGSDYPGIAVAHTALLQKLDAFLTMRQREAGDPAEILHHVRWQKLLYERRLQSRGAQEIVQRSTLFIDAWDRRKAGEGDYIALMKSLLGPLADSAKDLDAGGALPNLAGKLQGALDSPATLEREHRALLLRVQSL
ncbi:MAG: hypothetical protein EXR72_26235 [Myxococcales bacterium]|nr:hypothetical protein [Myxococcales bacterium]